MRETRYRIFSHGCCRCPYLRDVIERISTHPARLVLELTPREWKRLRQNPVAKLAA
ncbi:MAG: hypothetical protein ACLQU2_28965 [Candidatus Binataceae bacterium]